MNKNLNLFGFPELEKKAIKALPEPRKKKENKDKPYFGPLPNKISINPDCYTIYPDTSEIRALKRQKDGVTNNVVRVLNTGRMSRGALRRQSNACQYLYMIAPNKRVYNEKFNSYYDSKVTFLTLTLAAPQMHDDKWIKNNMLKHFIDACRNKFPALSYTWKGETQSNGNLHFHIMSDHFFPMKYINNLWFHIQWKAGYMQKFYEKHMGKFEDVEHEKKIAPPSVKVETAKDKTALARYMRKYMKKEQFTHEKVTRYKNELDQLYFDAFFAKNWMQANYLIKKIRITEKKIEESRKRLVEGKLWACSENLLVKQYIDLLDGCEEETFTEVCQSSNNVHVFSDDYISVYRIDDFAAFISRLGPLARDDIRKHFSKIFQRDKSGNIVTAPKNIEYSTSQNFNYSYEKIG